MDTRILEEIGLTKNEIKVYLTLLELGPTTAGPILEKAQIQNSVLHFCLNSLIEKGLVSYVKKGKVRIYQPASPESLIGYINSKKKELERILPELKEKQNPSKEKQEAEIFEGTKGVTTILNTLIEDAKPNNEFLFFSADVENLNKEIQEFYERYDSKRKEKRLIVKGIAPRKLKNLFQNRRYLQMRYVDFPIPENMGICNDKMAIISWENKPKGILITSNSIVDKERKFFNEVWKLARG